MKTETVECYDCGGTGRDFDPSHAANKRCTTCNGKGRIKVPVEEDND